jgi:hypothetical protein
MESLSATVTLEAERARIKGIMESKPGLKLFALAEPEPACNPVPVPEPDWAPDPT